MSVSIDIEEVVKKYGNDTIINGLSLHVKPGEFFTLLGPSGCGKTTLLRMIIGFNSIEGGKIKVDGRVVNDIPTNNRNMGMVFQNYAIFPHMSVKENVAFGLRMRKVPENDIDKQVDEILKIVKIDHLKDRMPIKLSGGQQQRVALARAIVIHPEVLLMDEPLSNLDAKLRVEMRNAIKSIQRQINITTVYVTHDQEEALAISDRIAIMHNGVIQQIDSPKNIYQRPVNTFVSTFIGLSNLIDAEISKNQGCNASIVFDHGYCVFMENIKDTVKNGQKILVSVRPEEFHIRSAGEGLKATIKSSVFLGLTTHYFVQLENGQDIQVIQDRDEQDIIPDGTTIILAVNPQKINVFHYENKTTLIRGGKE
ncbi:ABC transporter ATP-binding protein [Pelosinus propionicus]|uniref:Iron(III) transport system ATP-binding protein n=1 Tax=Pelosinus propionicus DSM 13327 TaxID=1123291 RepID=A0A1I4LNW0_9FIRM|nr:ABC transporter ATP-binding protein [Pelosinus propionicus]SFL92655.1 iron(III) transport system ATP-binding protein [Pelosinus propionicus DSM 13327]